MAARENFLKKKRNCLYQENAYLLSHLYHSYIVFKHVYLIGYWWQTMKEKDYFPSNSHDTFCNITVIAAAMQAHTLDDQ